MPNIEQENELYTNPFANNGFNTKNKKPVAKKPTQKELDKVWGKTTNPNLDILGIKKMGKPSANDGISLEDKASAARKKLNLYSEEIKKGVQEYRAASSLTEEDLMTVDEQIAQMKAPSMWNNYEPLSEEAEAKKRKELYATIKKQKGKDFMNSISWFGKSDKQEGIESYLESEKKYIGLKKEINVGFKQIIDEDYKEKRNNYIKLSNEVGKIKQSEIKTQDDYNAYMEKYNTLKATYDEVKEAEMVISSHEKELTFLDKRIGSSKQELDIAKRHYGVETFVPRTFDALADTLVYGVGTTASVIGDLAINGAKYIGSKIGTNDYKGFEFSNVTKAFAEGKEAADEDNAAYYEEQIGNDALSTVKHAGNLVISQIPNIVLATMTGGSEPLVAESAVAATETAIGAKAIIKGAAKAASNIAIQESKASKIVDIMAWTAEKALPTNVAEAGIFASSAGAKFSESFNSNNLPAGAEGKTSYSPLQMIASSALWGLAETVGEKAQVKLVGGWNRTIQAAIKENPSIIKDIAAVQSKALLGKGAMIVHQQVDEQVSEQFTNLSQNAINKFMLGKDVGLFDNVDETFKDTALLTGMMTTAPHIAGAVIKPFFTTEEQKQTLKIQKEIYPLVLELKNPVSKEREAAIETKIKALTVEGSSLHQKAIRRIGDMSTGTWKDIVAQSTEMAKIKAEARDVYNSNSENKNELLKGLQEKYDAIKYNVNEQLAATSALNNDILFKNMPVENRRNVVQTISEINRLKELSKKDNYTADLYKEKIKSLTEKYTSELADSSITSLDSFITKMQAKYKDFGNVSSSFAKTDADLKEKQLELLKARLDSDLEGKSDSAKKKIQANYDKQIASIEKEFSADNKDTVREAVVLTMPIYDVDGNIKKDKYSRDLNDSSVFINEAGVAQSGKLAATKANHEVLHIILNKAFNINQNAFVPLANALLDHIGTKSPELSKIIEAKIKKDYSGQKAGIKAEEVLTLVSELMASGYIEYDQSFGSKLKALVIDALSVVFPGIDRFDQLTGVKLDTGKDVFDFLSGYSKGFQEGKISSGVKKAMSKGVSGKLVGKTTDTSNRGGAMYSKSASTLEEKLDELDKLYEEGELDYDDYMMRVEAAEKAYKDAQEKPVAKKEIKSEKPKVNSEEEIKEIVTDSKGSVASDKVQAIYNAKGTEGAFEIIKLFRPITMKIVNKRRDAPGFDEELLRDEIETGDGGLMSLIKTYKPSSGVPLAAYINKNLPLRAIAASKRILDKEFFKDSSEEKGLMATETADQTMSEQVTEKPKYADAIESNAFDTEVFDSIKAKAMSTVRTLKTKINEKVSINKTITPIISEIATEMGKQADIDIKKALGGKEGGVLRKNLLRNKRYILENMTTTWLMGKDNGKSVAGGIPQAIQKKINGEWVSYPKWVGAKIDREAVSTHLAGRTAGHELVRRLPNAFNNVSNEDFLDQFLDPNGNPIRGRKESVSKAMAEEISFDLIKRDFLSDGPIYKAFEQNQERQGVELLSNTVNDFLRQADRGVIKYSKKSLIVDIFNNQIELINNFSKKAKPSKRIVKSALLRTFPNWDEKELEEIATLYTPTVIAAYKLFPVTAKVKPKDHPLTKATQSILNSNDTGVSISYKLGGTQAVSTFFKKRENINDLVALDYSFARAVVDKFSGDIPTNKTKGIALAMLNDIWKKTVAGRTGSGKKSSYRIYDGVEAFDNMLSKLKVEVGYKGEIPSLYKKSNYVFKNMFDGSFDKDKDILSSSKAFDLSSFAVEWYAKEIEDGENSFSVDHLAALCTLLIKENNSALRSGAFVKGVLKDSRIKSLKKYDYDHTMPARAALSYLIDKYVFDKPVNIEALKAQYYVTIIPKTAITKINDLGLKQMMPTDFILGATDSSIRLEKALDTSRVTMYSKGSLSGKFNEILEKTQGIGQKEEFSNITARTQGAGKGKFRFFVPPSAEDFAGLLYDFMGKGKEGEADAQFFKNTLIHPYVKGIQRIDNIRANIKEGYKALKAEYPIESKKLKKKVEGKDFTYDQAVRVYLWKANDITIPGLSDKEIMIMSNTVKKEAKLREFADKLSVASGQLKGWVEPTEYWNVESIVSDLHNATEKVGRRNILKEFIENSDEIFSPENLNKIEAALGTNYRSALEDSLFRMKNGSNQTSTDKFSGAFVNWIANANGTIMFLNTRSAILQTIAATNYLNWTDNNPVAAGAAFLNQPQYWKDFAMIFNSNKLKERREGLKADVNEAEIANAVKGSKNKAKAALSYLLKIGYTPTQIADSFAIAAGGSTFYRNRVKTYEKQGLSTKEAEDKAFEDFDNATEESQQSSDPSKLSQQQASTAGRLILAFANTPMQYNRLMKKAFRDLINGRGDAKTHVSKILYYGAVQNIVFSALQNALFATLFDDDEEDEKTAKANERKYANILNGMADTILRGVGITGAIVSTAKNVVTKFFEEREKGFKGDQAKTIVAALGISPPIGSKAAKLYSAINTEKIDKDIIAKRGMDFTLEGKLNLSPSYDIAGKVVASTTNFPLDRLVDKVNNVSEVLDSRNKTWQRVALALGWKAFDVGTINEGEDLIRAEAKAEKKEESAFKAAKDRIIKKVTLQKRIDNMSDEEYSKYQDSVSEAKEKKLERRRRVWDETEKIRDSIYNSK
jgi:hypothetical protein